MNLQDYKKRPRWYKVVDEESKYYGEVFDLNIDSIKYIEVYTENPQNPRLTFHKDDVQEVIPKHENGEWQPTQLNGEYVCVGDKYCRNKITDYFVLEKIYIVTESWNYIAYSLSPGEHNPMHSTEDDTDDIAGRLRDIVSWIKYKEQQNTRWKPLENRIKDRLSDLADELEGN